MADSTLLPSLIGSGAQLGGAILGQRSQRQTAKEDLAERKREFDLALQRKNQMLRLALPGMLTNLGYRSSAIPGLMSSQQTPQYAPILGGR